MTAIGIISVAANPAGIALEEWTQVIAAHPNLERVPSVEGVNPFTRAPMTFKGHPGDANVKIDGKIVGEMEWAPDDSNCIWVRGDPAQVSAIAADVAAKLGAVFRLD
jgi:hypothetical protein